MTKRHEIFEHANDLHVATVMVYPDSSKVLFYDEAHEEPVLTAELKDLFVKGIMTVVVSEDELAKPVAYTAAGVELADATVYTATEPTEE